jgi:hypothetical protein
LEQPTSVHNRASLQKTVELYIHVTLLLAGKGIISLSSFNTKKRSTSKNWGVARGGDQRVTRAGRN